MIWVQDGLITIPTYSYYSPLLYGMVNLSDLPIVERRWSKLCLSLRMVWQFSPLYNAAVANRRSYGEVQAQPVLLQGPSQIFWWPPWDIDSCLVLAPDPSAKKTQSEENHTKMKGHKNQGKLCHYRKSPEKEFSRESEKTDTVKNKDGVYEFW